MNPRSRSLIASRVRRHARLALLLFATACGAGPQPEPARATGVAAPRVTPWTEAAQRFRTAGAWLGADSAYSVDLGKGRVLWLFGDSFIDPTRDGSRTNGPNVLIRNSVALQTPTADGTTAYDLPRSTLSFYWRGTDANPSSFFPETADGRWFWPLHGSVLADGKLLLFRMQVAKVSGGLGFKTVGWDAIAIDDPGLEPERWTPRLIVEFHPDPDKLMGASVLLHEGYLYAYAVKNEDTDHASFLARWPADRLAGLTAESLMDPEWFSEGGSFQRQSAGARPAIVLEGAQVEFSVHFDRKLKRFVEIQMRGMMVHDAHTAIIMRTAVRPEGPWSAPQPVFRPRPSSRSASIKWVAYAAKAHPEQHGADLVLTYVINDLENLTPSDEVYYPEPLRLEL